jgi:hypothetical protein
MSSRKAHDRAIFVLFDGALPQCSAEQSATRCSVGLAERRRIEFRVAPGGGGTSWCRGAGASRGHRTVQVVRRGTCASPAPPRRCNRALLGARCSVVGGSCRAQCSRLAQTRNLAACFAILPKERIDELAVSGIIPADERTISPNPAGRKAQRTRRSSAPRRPATSHPQILIPNWRNRGPCRIPRP